MKGDRWAARAAIVSGIVIAACGEDGATSSPADGGTDAGAETGSSDAGGDSNAPSIPILSEALDGKCTGGKPPENGVAPGNDLHKITLTDPNALCNDGSPAIMYVRASSAPAAANRWVIHMQAGGACSSYDVCYQRWCGIGSYTADRMSSKFAPAVANASGLFARNAANDFGPANQVFLYYCSSDTWTGRRSDAVLEDASGARPSFRLHFRGHDILEAAATVLAKGAKSDDGAETLPSLTSATQVLFSGSSAGSIGLTSSLDWWASKAPNAQSFGVLDSFYMPLPEDIDDGAIAGKYVDGLKKSWSDIRGTLQNGFADESCLAAHPGADAYLCGLTTHVQLNHLTTPFLTRQDLTDPVSYNAFAPTGGTLDQYATWTAISLKRVADVKTNAEEKSAIGLAPGSHSSDCGQHIIMMNAPWFGVAASGNATVENTGGAPLTMHDALKGWASGTLTVHALDTHPSTKAVCAQKTNDQ